MSKLSNPRQYVDFWYTIHNLKVSPRGSVSENGNTKLTQHFFDRMWLDYEEALSAYNNAQRAAKSPIIQGCKESSLNKAFNELITTKQSQCLQDTLASIAFNGSNSLQIESFCQAVTGAQSELHIAVLKHWMWQVKRNMFGKPIVDHLMPIFYGQQGSGKSMAVRKLISPLEDYLLGQTFDQLTDERHHKSLSDSFVGFFDEMEGADRADVNTIKRLITATNVDYRPMRTNEVVSIRQNCSFIGATNTAISEMIVDRTGMRRFAEIKTLDLCDWNTINSLNYLEMWKSIDENLDRGYIQEHKLQLIESQKPLVAQDPITSFIKENNLLVTGESKEVLFKDVYAVYKVWCMDNGHKPLNSIWLGIRLANKGFQSRDKCIKGKTNKYLTVGENNSISLGLASFVCEIKTANWM